MPRLQLKIVNLHRTKKIESTNIMSVTEKTSIKTDQNEEAFNPENLNASKPRVLKTQRRMNNKVNPLKMFNQKKKKR